MKLVLIESPYAAPTLQGIAANVAYARRAMAHSLSMNEAPFAMHLLYTQEGILRDELPEERKKGIEAGLAWGNNAALSAFYIDLGFTKGMAQGFVRARFDNRACILRSFHREEEELTQAMGKIIASFDSYGHVHGWRSLTAEFVHPIAVEVLHKEGLLG